MSVVSVEKDYERLRLTLIADFDAPVERVWELWADPRQLERWWGPPTHPATFEKHELNIGGEASYVMTGPGGETSHGWWRVTAVDPPTSLEFTDAFANPDGTPDPALPTIAVQMRLAEHDRGTRMELRFAFASSEQMREHEDMGTFDGIARAVGQMDALLTKGDAVSATVLYMSMSLDGFIAGPNEGPDNGLGDGGHRLHEWAMAADGDVDLEGIRRAGGVNGQIVDEFMSTGATVAGRGTFEPAGGWGGDHHDGVPIFIVTRHGAELKQWPLVTYVDDVTAAMTRAKQAAGDKNVLVHGAGIARLALAAGVLDELELHVVPVLFGQGRRLFDGLAAEQIELERTRILEGEGGVTHMHYRVRR